MRPTLSEQCHVIEEARKKYLSEAQRELRRTDTEIRKSNLKVEINALLQSRETDASAKIRACQQEIFETKALGFKCAEPVFNFFVQVNPIASLSPLTADEKNNADFDLAEYKTKLTTLKDYLSQLSFYDSPSETAKSVLELWRITGHAVHLYSPAAGSSTLPYIELMQKINAFLKCYSGKPQEHRVIQFIQIFPDIDFEGIHQAFLTAINTKQNTPTIFDSERETLQELHSNTTRLNVAHPRDCFVLLNSLLRYIMDTRDCDRILADHLFQNGELDDSAFHFVRVALIEATQSILDGTPVCPLDRNTILLTQLGLEGFSLTRLKADLLAHINRKHGQLVTLYATAPEQSKSTFSQAMDRLQGISGLVGSLDITLGSRGVAKRRDMLMQSALYYCDSSAGYSRVTSDPRIIFSQKTLAILKDGIGKADQVKEGFCYDKAMVEAVLLSRSTAEISQRASDVSQESSSDLTSSASDSVTRGPNLFRALRQARGNVAAPQQQSEQALVRQPGQ